MSENLKYVASLDVGTTTVRCYIYNKNAEILGSATGQVELLYPQPGYVEIDPDELWPIIVKVIQDAIKASGLSASQITCLGISTQRSTFVTWDKSTGRHFHNFVTWKDLRADSLVRKWNDSFTMKGIRTGSHFLYMVTRSKRFLAGSVLRLMNAQTTLRLCWVLENNALLKEAVVSKKAMFGTLDTWLLYKLTAGKLHVTDISNAAATGFYDPFTLQWASWAIDLFKLPRTILPTVVDTAANHGETDMSLFGSAIPITCSMADQSASMWGSQCFAPGDVKVTLGTGSFLNVNTGRSPHASVMGMYPLVAWRNGDDLVYCVEGSSNDTGTVIRWACALGLAADPSESSALASSVADTDGVYFIPAFSGFGAPVNDHQAASGFLGVRPTSLKSHLMRAVLESLAFRVAQLYQCTQKETTYKFKSIRVDGGVSRNDLLCQLLADVTNLQVSRGGSEMSALGAGLLAGLHAGVWKSKEDIASLLQTERVFEPCLDEHARYRGVMAQWKRAVDRFCGWYDPQEVTSLNSRSMSSLSVQQRAHEDGSDGDGITLPI